MPAWANGRDTALYVTVVSPLQQCLLSKCVVEHGAALDHAYNRKVPQSWGACNKEGIVFVALPVATIGGLDKRAEYVLSKLGRQLARHTGKEDSEVLRQMFQRLSILIMQIAGQSSPLLSCSPDLVPRHVDGDMDSKFLK